MPHIDTLQVYQEYIQNGYTDQQAACAVKSLNASFDSVATKDDLERLEQKLELNFDTKLEKLELKVDNKIDKLEWSLKKFFVYLILSSLTASVFIPIILKKWGI